MVKQKAKTKTKMLEKLRSQVERLTKPYLYVVMDSKGMNGIPCSLDPAVRRDDKKHSMVHYQKKRSKVNIEKLL